MVAVTLPFVLAGLATLTAARDIPFRMVKRQGTLVASDDVTNFGRCSIPQIEGQSAWFVAVRYKRLTFMTRRWTWIRRSKGILFPTRQQIRLRSRISSEYRSVTRCLSCNSTLTRESCRDHHSVCLRYFGQQLRSVDCRSCTLQSYREGHRSREEQWSAR